MFVSMRITVWIIALMLLGLSGPGCQEKVVRTRNPYIMDANRGSADQRASSARDAQIRLNRHNRHQAAKHSDNPFAPIGAIFGDLADLLMPPKTSAPLSRKLSRPSTSFGGASGGSGGK